MRRQSKSRTEPEFAIVTETLVVTGDNRQVYPRTLRELPGSLPSELEFQILALSYPQVLVGKDFQRSLASSRAHSFWV